MALWASSVLLYWPFGPVSSFCTGPFGQFGPVVLALRVSLVLLYWPFGKSYPIFQKIGPFFGFKNYIPFLVFKNYIPFLVFKNHIPILEYLKFLRGIPWKADATDDMEFTCHPDSTNDTDDTDDTDDMESHGIPRHVVSSEF